MNSRDYKGVGMANEITSPKSPSIFPDDDGEVLNE